MTKVFPLPIFFLESSQNCKNYCNYCTDIAAKAKHKRTYKQYIEEIDRANILGYKTIVFSCALQDREYLQVIIDYALKSSFHCVLLIHINDFLKFTEELQNLTNHPNFYFCIKIQSLKKAYLNKINFSSNMIGLYVLTDETRKLSGLKMLKKIGPNHIYFFIPTSPFKNFILPNALLHFSKKYKYHIGNKNLETIEGLHLNNRAFSYKENIIKEFETFKDKNLNNYLLSVIIPTFNSIASLLPTLESVFSQDKIDFNCEIILVDDSSNDGTKEKIESWLSNKKTGSVNRILYLYLKSSSAKSRGGYHFHAGAARNIGVNNSWGEYILFLDSDIILPPNYFWKLNNLKDKYDVIQPKRLNFVPKSDCIDYDIINTKYKKYEADNAFMKPIYFKPWDLIKNKWKYVCTYCLFLSKKNFLKHGPFSPSFHSYGHEDTELGWKLAQNRCSFHFITDPVFHMAADDSRSEYKNSILTKNKVLLHSAKTFYSMHPYNEIYDEIKWIWPDQNILYFILSGIYKQVMNTILDVRPRIFNSRTFIGK